MPEKITWSGDLDCNFCGAAFENKTWFVDGRTILGPWAVMCPACFRKFGLGLGTGVGQKYSSTTLSKLEG